jgi:hypothetical protein
MWTAMPPRSSAISSTSPVQASPDLQAVLGQLSPDGVGVPDGPGRAIEAR